VNITAIILAYPMVSIIVDKSYSVGAIMASLIVIHNIAVLGLFALENITMAEIFGSRNRFTRMAISKNRWFSCRRLWSGTGRYFL
jgi:MHS family metabolite:H+ symporter-like MFS transporter